MAANISTNNGIVEFGRIEGSATPWWGEGQIVPKEHGNNAKQFAIAAKCDFTIATRKLKYGEFGQVVDCVGDEKPDLQTVYRVDNGRTLSTVGPVWTPHQFVDSCQFLQTLLDTGKCHIQTMGALGNGERQWATIALGKGEVCHNDSVENYLLHVVNNQVGAVGNYRTTVRTICQNTMQSGIAMASSKLRVWHGSQVRLNVQTALEIIDAESGEFQATLEQWQKLVKATLCKADLETFVKKLFDVENDEKISTRKANQISEIVGLAFKGKGNNGSTLWDALNGVTEYYSHYAGHNNATRLESTWFGQNAKMITKAEQIAFEMLAS